MKTLVLLIAFFPFLLLSQKVKITVQTHIPYCGAARPTAEIGKGHDEISANYVIVLIERTSKKSVQITTDKNGNWTGKLKKGVYEAYRLDKTLSNEELKYKYKLENTENFRFLGDECLNEWKLENDGVIEVSSKK